MNFIHNKNQIALYSPDQQLLAEVTFPDIDEDTVDINHTYVDSSLRGQGVAGKLMLELVEELRKQNRKAIPTCSYAVKWFAKHNEYQDVLGDFEDSASISEAPVVYRG